MEKVTDTGTSMMLPAMEQLPDYVERTVGTAFILTGQGYPNRHTLRKCWMIILQRSSVMMVICLRNMSVARFSEDLNELSGRVRESFADMILPCNILMI